MMVKNRIGIERSFIPWRGTKGRSREHQLEKSKRGSDAFQEGNVSV